MTMLLAGAPHISAISCFERGKPMSDLFGAYRWLVLTTACLISSQAAVAQQVFKASTVHPDDYPVTVAMQRFASEVDRRTSGRYKIEVVSRGALTAIWIWRSSTQDRCQPQCPA
jgi:hypothetical protein